MLITAMTPKGKTKTRVEIDEDLALVLSNKEIAEYDIREGEELPEETYVRILQNLRSRVLKKCGDLLRGGDYTGKRLHDKLVQNGYPEMIAEEAVEQMEEAGYVDDRRYTENYLRYHSEDKSRGRCRMDLMARGVSSELIDEVMTALEQAEGREIMEREVEQIHTLMRKRHYNPDDESWEQEQQLRAYLMRKGYTSDVVRTALRTYSPG